MKNGDKKNKQGGT